MASNLRRLTSLLSSKSGLNIVRGLSTSSARANAAAAVTEPAAAQASKVIPPPNLEGQPKNYSAKIDKLVTEIASLNLGEVADLNELLRKRLNIKDVAMSYAAAPAGGAAAPAKAEEADAEEAMPKVVQSSFKLKIMKYDDTKKVAIIKEIKALGENMNLVQAKKFIESVPQVFKDNISKEDAEKLKAQLEKAGATCVIE
jgi:large subunit ribosomal protein L7/L12